MSVFFFRNLDCVFKYLGKLNNIRLSKVIGDCTLTKTNLLSLYYTYYLLPIPYYFKTLITL